jgi:hypothetical protein
VLIWEAMFFSDCTMIEHEKSFAIVRFKWRGNDFTNLGQVVQSPISVNSGLNFNLPFLFMYFCMIIRLKTLENKTSIEPESISGKTYSTWLMSCWKI